MIRIILHKIKNYLKENIYPVSKDWKKIQCVNDRYTLKAYYEKKRPLLQELSRNQDVQRLREELVPYHEKLWHYYASCKITIKFDEEVFSLYRSVYLKDTAKSQINSLIRHIPKAWR